MRKLKTVIILIGTIVCPFLLKAQSGAWSTMGSGITQTSGNFGGVSMIEYMEVDSQSHLLYIGGDFYKADGQSSANLAIYDGSNYKYYSKNGYSGPSDPVLAIKVIKPNEIYLGGFFEYITTNKVEYIGKWDGSLSSVYQKMGGGLNLNVNALTYYNNKLYAGGNFAGEIGNSTPMDKIARWTGTQWEPVPDAQFASAVNNFAIFNGDLISGGAFSNWNNIVGYNGTTWYNLGTGLNGRVRDMEVYKGELYACGDFTDAGGLTVNYIAR